MNRREFIVQMGAALIAVPAILSLESCGGNGSSSDGFFDVTSSSTGHTHAVRVLNSDITNPPGNGVQYTSTNVNSHVHTLTLSQAQLTDINNGNTVGPITSDADSTGHSHTWTIRKP
jgi:hypothetical protein